MAFKKVIRVLRSAEAGLMLTCDEVRCLVGKNAFPNSEYRKEISELLDSIADNAQVVGRTVCGAHCELVCSGTELTGQQTDYDGDLAARCTSRVCSDAGIITATAQFKAFLDN